MFWASGAETIFSLGGQELRRQGRDAEGVKREGEWGGGVPLRGVHPPTGMMQHSHPSLSSPSPSSFPFSLSPLPLEVGPIKSSWGSGRQSSPSGVWGRAQPKLNLVHFSLKI